MSEKFRFAISTPDDPIMIFGSIWSTPIQAREEGKKLAENCKMKKYEISAIPLVNLDPPDGDLRFHQNVAAQIVSRNKDDLETERVVNAIV